MSKTIEFDGKQHVFPDDFSDADISAALASVPAPSSMAADVAKSGGIGLAKGAIGLAGLPGDIRELTAQGIAAGANKLFGNRPTLSSLITGETKDAVSPETISRYIRHIPLLNGPTSGQMQSAIEQYAGKFYEPQTTTGRFAQTAGEFAPAVFGGPGSIGARLATRVAAPAAAATGVGELGGGPIAQTAAALATPAGLAGARRLVTPLPMAAARAPAVQALEGEGVRLSAGQRSGSRPLQYFEQALGDLPGSGRGAATVSERSAEQFTAAALRRAGENTPRATPEVVDRAFTRIGNRFDELAQRNTLHVDQRFGTDIQDAIRDYHGIVSPPNRAPVIQDFMAEIGTGLQRHNGTLPGDTFQSLTSRIERAARAAKGSPEVADTLRDMRAALNDAMERSISRSGNMADLGAWREVRNQYRNMLVIERAATGAGENAALGLISPSQLRNATVGQNRRAYARGNGDFAELARSGEAVMKPLPQSGTAPRSYAQHLPVAIGAAIGGTFAGVPGAALGGAAAITGPPIVGRLLMSRPVQGYLGNQLLQRQPRTARERAIQAVILARQGGILRLPDPEASSPNR